MIGNNALIVVALTAVSGVLGASSAMGSDHRPRERGFVMPCSLDGVNPTYHPDIFGNPAVARSYGFVRSPGGTWQVVPNCRR
jgi:hypothetical protein